MIRLDVRFLHYREIARVAADFLATHHPSVTIPIPIEEIIEFNLQIDIVPTPNLQRDFDIEGFTSSDLRSIYVDDSIYSNRPYRYRFTLAHEVGHIVLHRDLFQKFGFDSVSAWKEFENQVDPHDYQLLEFQGYNFGGLILVPPNQLKKFILDNVRSITSEIEEAKAAGLNRDNYLPYAVDTIAYQATRYFEVSQDVVLKRIGFDGLTNLIP